MSTDEPLIAALRAAFAAHADAAQAAPMQAYMKSALPFYGIAAPLRRRLTAEAVKAHPAADSAALVRTMRALWRGARFREERYAAVELPRLGRLHPKRIDLSLGRLELLLKRLGHPEEYAKLAVCMIETGYFNGEDVRLDGGIRMAPR